MVTGGNGMVRSCMILTKYYWGDQIKRDKMRGAHTRNGADERCVQEFG